MIFICFFEFICAPWTHWTHSHPLGWELLQGITWSQLWPANTWKPHVTSAGREIVSTAMTSSIEQIWTTFSVGKGETWGNHWKPGAVLFDWLPACHTGITDSKVDDELWCNVMGPFLQRYVLWIFCWLSPSPIENYLIDVIVTSRPTSELRAAFQTVDFGDLPEAAVESRCWPRCWRSAGAIPIFHYCKL